MDTLSNTDSLMWVLENDPLLRSTILGVLVLDHAPEWERVERRMHWLVGELPMLRHRVAPSTVNPARLHWEPIGEFDLGYHLRRMRLSEGQTFDDVLTFARTSAMAGFDKARPLWEFTLVDGLPDGRAALVTKLHHVLTDGIGAVQLALHMLDLEEEPANPRDLDAHADLVVSPPDPVVRVAADVIHEIGVATDVVTEQLAHAVPNLMKAVLHPRQTIHDATEVAKSVGRTVAPTLTTLSPVMRHRSTTSEFHVIEVPLAQMKAAAKAVGGSVNDAFMAGITGGLRIYHEHHLAPVDELRVAMPISLRVKHDAEGGNHVTVMRFPVAVGIADPGERMHAMAGAVSAQRNEASLPHTDTVAGVLNRVPNALIGAMLKHVDFLASNVPGTPIPLFLEGARVQAWYPFGPAAGASMNVTLLSYCEMCCIGVNLDASAVPDGELFMRCLREGFDEVLALA